MIKNQNPPLTDEEIVVNCDRCGYYDELGSAKAPLMTVTWDNNRVKVAYPSGMNVLCDKCSESFFQFMRGKALTL